MSARVYIGWFDDEHAVVHATAAAREAGLQIHDVYSPFALHGLDRAMGLGPSRLTLVCFGAGMLGLSGAALLQHWTSVASWPLNIGGKPFASWPAFVPVMFELAVLCAALITVAALFLRERLFWGAGGGAPARTTDDRFALALSTCGARFDAEQAAEVLMHAGAISVGFEEVDR